MNRRELLEGAAAIGTAIALSPPPTHALPLDNTPSRPVRVVTPLEQRLIRQGMYPTAPMIVSVQTQRTAFVEGDEVGFRNQVLVRLQDGTDHMLRDPEAMRLAWSQIMARQKGVSRNVAYDQNWIEQIGRLV